MKTSLILSIVSSIAIIAFFAQFSIDLSINGGLIPITGQTFAVLLVGYFLGKKWGTLAVALYVLLGLAGLPILADGKAGWSVLTSGSGGYLIGFIIGAFACGWLRERMTPNFFNAFLNQTIGTIIILTFGVAWLSYLHGFGKALEYGFYPFWVGAVVKVVLAAGVIIGVRKFT
ncbi:MAG: biotin transporter BioY [Saprospiraceae bacterium]